MKKLLIFFFTLLAFLLSATALIAQEVAGGAVEATGFDITTAFATFSALVAATTFLVEGVKKLIGKTTDTPNWIVQVTAWGVGVILALLGWITDAGFLGAVTWQWALIYGFGASLAANGVADTKIVLWVLSLFKKK